MSFRNLRIIATAGVAAASIVSSTGAAPAREYRKPIEMEPLHHDNDHEIIFEMEPLHPVKRAAPVAPVATPEESVKTAQPAKNIEPKAAKSAKTAPAKIGAAAKPAPVNARDVAPKAAETAAEAKSAEQPKAAQQAKPAEQSAPRAIAAPTPAEAPQAAPTQVAAPNAEEAPKDAAKEAAKEALAPTEAAPVAAAPEQSPATEPAPVANSAPASAAAEQPAPVADGSQPVPLPLEEALHPQAKTASDAPASEAQASASPAASKGAPASASDTAQAQPKTDAPAQPAASAPQPAPAEAAAPAAEAPAVDSAARIGKLLGEGMKGPVEVRIGDRATMFLPAGRTFVADAQAQELARLAGFDWRPTMRGLITPTGDKLNWLAPVEVLEGGYIKSDVPLDADKLLSAFGAGLPEVNAQRVKGGQNEVELSGWLSPPTLDQAKHRVSACVNVATKGGDAEKYFNCEAWSLGRDGAIKVSLAEAAAEGDRLKGEAAQLAETVVFDHGKTYEEIDVASDKIAPYTVADLLTSDVTAKAAPAPAAEENEEGSGDNTLLITLVALLGGSAALFWLRRQKAAAPPAPKPESARAPAQGGEPSSLFARLLPSVHAKFARKSAEPPANPATPVYQTAPATAAPASATDNGLLGKIAGLRNKSADASQPAAAPADNREAASALQMLATRMRRTAPAEEPVEKVDVSRALRAASRSLPGAAPEPVASPVTAPVTPPVATSTVTPAMSPAPAVEARSNAAIEMPAPAVTPEARPASAASAGSARDARPAVASDDSFGLVEPGDAEAAMHARETLRQANG